MASLILAEQLANAEQVLLWDQEIATHCGKSAIQVGVIQLQGSHRFPRGTIPRTAPPSPSSLQIRPHSTATMPCPAQPQPAPPRLSQQKCCDKVPGTPQKCNRSFAPEAELMGWGGGRPYRLLFAIERCSLGVGARSGNPQSLWAPPHQLEMAPAQDRCPQPTRSPSSLPRVPSHGAPPSSSLTWVPDRRMEQIHAGGGETQPVDGVRWLLKIRHHAKVGVRRREEDQNSGCGREEGSPRSPLDGVASSGVRDGGVWDGAAGKTQLWSLQMFKMKGRKRRGGIIRGDRVRLRGWWCWGRGRCLISTECSVGGGRIGQAQHLVHNCKTAR